MAIQVSPGINVSEIDLTTTVPPVSTSVGGIAGVFGWGPIGEATLVSSETDLVSKFGYPTSINPETFMTAASFLAYSSALYVSRAANTTTNNIYTLNLPTNANTVQANVIVTQATTGATGNVISSNTSTLIVQSLTGVFSAGYAITSSVANTFPAPTSVSTAAIAAFNAVANTNVMNVANAVVKSSTDYYNNRINSIDPNALYVANYPGVIGNSLRISVCDSVNAYSSNVALTFSNSSANIQGTFALNIGSNSALLTFVANTTVADANAYATTVNNAFTIGDIVTVGNSTIGTQDLSINSIVRASNTSAAYITLGFETNYLKSTAYAANSTINGNTTAVTIQRGWKYKNLAPAPTTSTFVQQYGNSSAVDTVSVVISDQGGLFTGVKGTVLEVFSGLSRATDAVTIPGNVTNYYKTVISQNSKYVWFGNDRPGATSATAATISSSTNQTPMAVNFVGGQDGSAEGSVQFADLANAYDLFKDRSIPVSLIMQGKPYGGTTTVNNQTVNNFQLANYLIDNLGEVRKDVVVFVTPDDAAVTSYQTNIAQSLVNWFGALHDSSYSVVDSGYKYMYDRYNDVYRYVPTNGDVAGLCARTDQTNDPWWSPAGLNRGQIKNLVKLRWNPMKADRDVLYLSSINPLVTFPGQGTVLFGDKTGTLKPTAFQHINVRRLFIVLEKSISEAARYSLFEFNDEFTRSQFRNLVTPYLRNVQARRGITDFLVVCDTSNNPPVIIDSNQFVGDIYVKPNRSINFIQLNFVATPTGVQFSTVIGKQ